MGLMLDALKQIEVGVPLPPVARFSFPAVPEPPESASPMEAPAPGRLPEDSCRRDSPPHCNEGAFDGGKNVVSNILVWPDCDDAATQSSCTEMADGILRQLSAGADIRPLSSGADIPVCSLARPAVVALTSPGDGDGKTSLLLALAPQLARRIAGGILVVDANFRKPDLTVRLGGPAARRWGSSCAATLGATVQQSPQQTAARPAVVCPTNLPHLNVLPASGADKNAGTDKNVCPPPTLASWIDELREDWPLVILDAPSLAYAEAAPLARCCDGAYLVVRLGYTARRAVAEAAHALRAKGGRLLGCLVVK